MVDLGWLLELEEGGFVRGGGGGPRVHADHCQLRGAVTRHTENSIYKHIIYDCIPCITYHK